MSASFPKRLLGAPDDAVLTRADAESLVARAMRLSQADDLQLSLAGGTQTNVRFADNRITTAGSSTNLSAVVQSTFGRRSASVSTNDLSDEGLARAVRQSEALAKLAPESSEALPPLGAQEYVPVDAWVERTAALTPEARAQAARAAIEAAVGAKDLTAAGFIQTGASAQAVGNKRGLFAYHRATSASYTLTMRTTDGTGSGWAGADHPDWSQIDARQLVARATEKARRSRNPSAIEPGRYTVILEPQAVGDLVGLLGGALDARAAGEGRSAFAKQGGGTRVGERVVDPRVTLLSDPADPQLLGTPYDGQGLPLRRQLWIENGVLKTLVTSRFWGERTNQPPTGGPSTLKLTGGDASLEDMIRATQRGVLVTRLWYLRQVDPRTVVYTGLTRDGTFLVENGRIARSIRNMRFNESPLFVLNNLDMIGRPVRVAGDGGGAQAWPALKVRDFNFTSLSEAV
jgi:predicted Zn-dependent protease